MKQCIARNKSLVRCTNAPGRNGLFCTEHRLWLISVLVALVFFLSALVPIIDYLESKFAGATCPPKIGQSLHVTVGAKVWSQPDVFQGTVTKVFQDKVKVFVLDGPVTGPVVSSNSAILGDWWKISIEKGKEGIGWIWQGRFDVCQP